MNKEIEELLNMLKKEDDYWSKTKHDYPFPDYYSLNREDLHLLLSYIEQLQTNVKDCKQKLVQYENPEDLTLFYMWLDTKAKDKMKQMEAEITNLKQQNQIITELGEQLENNRDKAIEYVKEFRFATVKFEQHSDTLLIILKGDSDE